jgi:hypothetical protein
MSRVDLTFISNKKRKETFFFFTELTRDKKIINKTSSKKPIKPMIPTANKLKLKTNCHIFNKESNSIF